MELQELSLKYRLALKQSPGFVQSILVEVESSDTITIYRFNEFENIESLEQWKNIKNQFLFQEAYQSMGIPTENVDSAKEHVISPLPS